MDRSLFYFYEKIVRVYNEQGGPVEFGVSFNGAKAHIFLLFKVMLVTRDIALRNKIKFGGAKSGELLSRFLESSIVISVVSPRKAVSTILPLGKPKVKSKKHANNIKSLGMKAPLLRG